METATIQTLEGQQSIRIPEGLRINDEKVYLKKMGDVLFIIPYSNPWQGFYDSLGEFSPDFMNDREQPSTQTRPALD